MSETSTAIDPRATLIGWTNGLLGMYLADIKAIPDDKWNSSMGGCSRPPSEMTAEVVSLLDWTAAALQGDARPATEEELTAKAKSDCSTKEGAAAQMKRAVVAFSRALKDASDETLSSSVTAPWGLTAPLFTIAHITSSHIWYHDGQLNYIQCLLGDGKYHWHSE
jgi:hypothetical protein